MKTFFMLFWLMLFIGGCGGGVTNYDESSEIAILSEIKESESPSETVKAFFGDKQNNRVLVVDVNKMRILDDDLYTHHQITYTADKVYGEEKVYVVNRGSDAIDVVDTKTHQLLHTIPLMHHPRSAEAMNKTYGLCAVSGMDKAMVSIIDIHTDQVVAVVGEESVTYPVEHVHGGQHACGHPFWLDDNHFVVIDRARKKIATYAIYQTANGKWQTDKLNELSTPSSVHQIIPSKGYYRGAKNIFYATAEGSDEQYPAILMFLLMPNGLFHTNDIVLKKEGIAKEEMGLHHADFHPFKPYIYVGSSEGTLFVVDYSDLELKLVKTIPVGKGAGHTVMIPARKLAIVINHKDKFISVIDLVTDTKIKDIPVSYVSDDLVGKRMIQAHPKYYVSADHRYFYAFLTEEGVMYRVDLDHLEVRDALWVGGKPAQGSFVITNSAKKSQPKEKAPIDFRMYLPTYDMYNTYWDLLSSGIKHERVEVFPDRIFYAKDTSGNQTEYLIDDQKITQYQISSSGEKKLKVQYNRYMKLGDETEILSGYTKESAGKIIETYEEHMLGLDFGGIHYNGDLIKMNWWAAAIRNESRELVIGDVDYYHKKGVGKVAFSGSKLWVSSECATKVYKSECVQIESAKWYNPDLSMHSDY